MSAAFMGRGFARFAVQLARSTTFRELPADAALILVHVLNPFGMTYLRRGNENNVDLNRNFFFGIDGWRGVADEYAALDDFLNPPAHLPESTFFTSACCWPQ